MIYQKKRKKNHRKKDNISIVFSSQRERSHTIYCVFNGDWGYSPTSRFFKNTVREFWIKSQGVYHLALLANIIREL